MKRHFLFRAMYVYLLISIIFCGSLEAKSRKTKSVPGTAIFVMATPKQIDLQTIHYKKNLKNMSIEINIPQFTGLDNHHFQKSINHELKSQGKARQQDIVRRAFQFKKDLDKDDLSSLHLEYIENFTPIESCYPFVVVEQFKYQYNGGAHGLGTYDYLVIDLLENKRINLETLFKKQVDYKAIIDNEIQQIIAKKGEKEDIFFKGHEGFQGIQQNQPFYINSQGDLIIVFNTYEIAPYSAGPQFFTISRQVIEPYLK